MTSPGALAERLGSRIDRLASSMVSRAVGHDVDLAVRPTLSALKRGRFGTVQARLADLDMAGIRLRSLHVDAAGVGIRLGLPPRLVVGSADVAVTVDQRAVDRWGRQLGLPARLVLRPGRLVARLGVAGLRLGQIDMDVTVAARGLRLAPRRFATLGMELRAQEGLDVVIPLPALPAGAALTSVDWGDGVGHLSLHADDLDVRLRLSDLRAARNAARRLAGPRPASTDAQDPAAATARPARPAVGRQAGTRPPVAIDLDVRSLDPGPHTLS